MPIRVSNVTAQVLFIPTDIYQTVTDTLVFVEEPFARKLRVSNLTVQILQLESGRLAFASNTMSMSQLVTVLNSAGDRQPVSDEIFFTQTANVPSHPFVEDVLEFTETVRPSIWNLDAAHDVNLRDYAGTCSGAPWTAIELSDTITFIDIGSKTQPFSLSSTITFSDSVFTSTAPEGGGHTLDLVHSVSAGIGHSASSEIEFTQAVQSFSDFLRDATDANFIEHSMTYYIDNGCSRKQYARFTGEGSAAALEEQPLIFDSSFVLESIEVGTVLILRSPETDDVDRLGFNRINRETRGGELNVYSDPAWAEVETLLFTITALSDGDGQCPDAIGNLLQFLQDNLGQEILLHDWTGTSWRGVITTPDESATEDDDGWWTISFEFEGTALGGSVPNNVMSISDSFTMNADWARPLADTLAFTEAITVGGDIYAEASSSLDLTQTLTGVQEIDIMHDDFTAGSAVDLEGTSPTIGTGTWRAHQEYQDDGTMDNPIDAGAYYSFTPVDGTIYELTFESAAVTTYSDGDNCIFGFFEDKSVSDLISGAVADGTLNPTAAKAVHLMRETDGSIRNNAYRRGSDSDGTADTVAWTDGTLNASADAALDLRILLDTTGGTGNWKATWQAKATASGSYTEVGPETDMLNENVAAVGWANDTINTDCTLDEIRLKELRPV